MRDEREQSGGASEYDLAQQQQAPPQQQQQAPAQGQPPAQQQQQPPPPAQEQQYQQQTPGQEQQGHEHRQGEEHHQGREHQPGEGQQRHEEHGHEEHRGQSAAEVAQGERPGEGSVASTPLLQPQDAKAFERRWEDVQVSFVDQPRSALQKADDLVDEVMKRISQRFADERAGLEGQWGQGGEVSTEDMRVALQHYRSFFNRLLKVQEGH